MLLIKKGSTDQRVRLRAVDAQGQPVSVDHATAGLALWYQRAGGLKVDITPIAQSALNAAHTDGGVEPVSDGYFQVDVPDAAFATGADSVLIGGSATDVVIIANEVQLVVFDPQDNRLGLTGIPTANPGEGAGLSTHTVAQGTATAVTNLTNAIESYFGMSGTLRGSILQIEDLLEADRVVDTGVTPWALVLIKKGSGQLGDEEAVELLRQPLYDTAGNPVTSRTAVIGKAVSP